MNPKLVPLHQHLAQTVIGAEVAAIELIAAILANGHILIEGPPGVGKTTLAKTFAQVLSAKFKRVQFTPDLLPSDLLGYSMYHQDKKQFNFIQGPVFTNLLLADEINRTSPRIQSALLECMSENQVSIDGQTHRLPDVFHVIATRNNRYTTGTFPLPEPQLDRFIASIEISLPPSTAQVSILEHHLTRNPQQSANQALQLSIEDVQSWQQAAASIHVSRDVCEYIVRLCEAVRQQREIESGLSNRAAIALTRMAQSFAFLNEHSGVHPDDVKRAFIPTLAHRITSGESAFQKSLQRHQIVALLNSILNEVSVD